MSKKKDTKKKETTQKTKKKTTKKATKKTTKKKETPKRKKAKQIDRNEMIACRNVTDNGVTYISPRTGLKYSWGEYGDIEYIEFGELLTMKSNYPKFFTMPWIVPEDEDVIERLGIEKIYDNLIPLNDLENFFRKPLDEIHYAIRRAPKGNRDALAIKARKMIENRTLHDLRIIEILEKELQIELRKLM